MLEGNHQNSQAVLGAPGMNGLREVNNRDVGVNLDIHISFGSVKYSRHSTFFSKISYLTTLSPLILLTLMLLVANLANTKS